MRQVRRKVPRMHSGNRLKDTSLIVLSLYACYCSTVILLLHSTHLVSHFHTSITIKQESIMNVSVSDVDVMI